MQNKRSSMHLWTTRLCSIWERPKFWEKLQFFEKFFLVILGQKLLFSSDFLSKLYFNLLLTIFYRFRSKISIFREIFLCYFWSKLLFSDIFRWKLYFNFLLTIFYRFRLKISICRANDMHLGAERYFTKKRMKFLAENCNFSILGEFRKNPIDFYGFHENCMK